MLKDETVIFGQSGSLSRFNSRKFVTNRDTTVDPVGLMPFFIDAFLLCVGPEVVEGVVAELAADKGRSMGPRFRAASVTAVKVEASNCASACLLFLGERGGNAAPTCGKTQEW